MKTEEINKYICSGTASIVDAMGRIDANAKGIIFVTDEESKLIGALTDGDIRRWILNAGKLSAAVANAMNRKPLSLTNEKDADKLMREKSITAIPIVDDCKCITDICFLSDHINRKKKSLVGIPVVVMAGGKGTRLYPYTKILPKPLIPIGDTPIVERIIDYYTDFGMNDFYMTVNYKKAMIRSYFDEVSKDYTIHYIEEDKPLGTGGSIKLIPDKFDRPLFVTNCDALIIADYSDIYKYHLEAGNVITMVSALKNFQVPYGVLHTGDNGVLESIEEKPKLSYFINTGMYIINPDIIDIIPDDVVFHMTHLVEKVMEQGGKVGTYPVSEDSFLDMGELSEMKRMEEKLHIVSN